MHAHATEKRGHTVRVSAGTRASEQPTHMYVGFWATAMRSNRPGFASCVLAAHLPCVSCTVQSAGVTHVMNVCTRRGLREDTVGLDYSEIDRYIPALPPCIPRCPPGLLYLIYVQNKVPNAARDELRNYGRNSRVGPAR